MIDPTVEHVESLKAIARGSPALMAALVAARSVGLPSWCIGAGAVRNAVWDHLHDRPPSASLEEVDLVYFDPRLLREHEEYIEGLLSRSHPGFTWDVTNQAHVHLWYERSFATSA